MIIQKNSAKAVIFEGRKLLMLRKEYEDGTNVYTLPGGTQEPGEALSEAVVREVYEEVGAKVDVLDLVKVYEHQRLSRTTPDVIKSKLEFAFLCRLTEAYVPHNGEAPDSHQVAVEWINLDVLGQHKHSPAALVDIIPSLLLPSQAVYLGKLN